MGTNYYLREDACPHCGRSDSQLHIGKSSAGWCFSLHVIPEEGLNSLEDWQKRWSLPRRKIFDEYDREVSPEAMLDKITKRDWPKPRTEEWPAALYASKAQFYEMNHAQEGPNNLLRHSLDPDYCIGHGEGNYDLMVGEFNFREDWRR